jgi:DNA polymerase III epsilon subunit-like protein
MTERTLVLGLDFETTGLPKYGKENPADGADQPRACAVAAALHAPDGTQVKLLDTLIKPDGWTISAELTAIHGLTTEMCEAGGRPGAEVWAELESMMEQAAIIVGHNISFDLKIQRGEFRRCGRPDHYGEVATFCTMWECRKARGLKKPPKLVEAVQLVLGREMPSAHSALHDMRHAIEIYFTIKGECPAPVAKLPWKRDFSEVVNG